MSDSAILEITDFQMSDCAYLTNISDVNKKVSRSEVPLKNIQLDDMTYSINFDLLLKAYTQLLLLILQVQLRQGFVCRLEPLAKIQSKGKQHKHISILFECFYDLGVTAEGSKNSPLILERLVTLLKEVLKTMKEIKINVRYQEWVQNRIRELQKRETQRKQKFATYQQYFKLMLQNTQLSTKSMVATIEDVCFLKYFLKDGDIDTNQVIKTSSKFLSKSNFNDLCQTLYNQYGLQLLSKADPTILINSRTAESMAQTQKCWFLKPISNNEKARVFPTTLPQPKPLLLSLHVEGDMLSLKVVTKHIAQLEYQDTFAQTTNYLESSVDFRVKTELTQINSKPYLTLTICVKLENFTKELSILDILMFFDFLICSAISLDMDLHAIYVPIKNGEQRRLPKTIKHFYGLIQQTYSMFRDETEL